VEKRSRRTFLKESLAIPAGAAAVSMGLFPAVGCAKPASTKGYKIKLSCCAYSYRQLLTSGKWTMFDFINKAVELDLDGVELTSYYFAAEDEQYMFKLKRDCYLKGLDISGTAVGNNFVTADAAKRAEQVKLIKKGVDWAVALGAPFVRVFGGHQVPEGHTEKEALGWIIDGLKEAVDYAGKKGVFLGLENHGGLPVKAEQVLAVLDGVNSEWLGLNLDVGNFRVDPYNEIEQVVSRAITCHVKVDIYDPKLKKRVPIDVDRIAGILKKAGYRGYISIEYEGKEDPLVAIPRFASRLRQAMA